MRFCATVLLAATAFGLRLAPMVRGPTLAARAAITMGGDGPVYVPKDAKGKTPKIPSGPFGGYFDPDEAKAGWVGDRSRSKQIEKFEKGSDYLFFQGPAPKTAIQEDVPNFFSPVCAASNRQPNVCLFACLTAAPGSAQENVQSIVADIKITPLRIGIGLTGSASAAIILFSLVAAPGSQSPFKFLDRFYPPAIAKKKVDTVRDDKIKAEAKAAKDKAAAEGAAKKAAAEKAAEMAKAAADKAAVAPVPAK